MITVEEIIDTPGNEDVDPDMVALRIQRATATLGRELGYYLGPPIPKVEYFRNDWTRSRSGYGPRVLWLENTPVAETLITVEHSNGANDPYVAFPVEDFVVEGRRLELATGYWWPTIRVTYTAGYDPAAVPPTAPQELAALVRAMVIGSLQNDDLVEASSSDFKSEKMGDYSYDRGDVSAAAVAVLGEDWTTFVSRWRKLRIG